MPRLLLESSTDVLDLDDVLYKGRGVQATAGVTGMGLPPVAVQWLEGAGDGAVFRGKRELPRDIDLPLMVDAGYDQTGDTGDTMGSGGVGDSGSRARLVGLLARLEVMLAGECTLRLVEDDGTSWSTTVHRTGGGDYAYGSDTTGDRDLFTVVTLRAGDPFWTYSVPERRVITSTRIGRGLVSKLAHLRVTPSETFGEITLVNTGTVPTFPVWEIVGPGNNFKATSPTGEVLHWTGTLAAGAKLTIDTRACTVVDHNGVNRYAELAPAPRFWTVPPGISKATVTLAGASPGGPQRVDTPRVNYIANPSFEFDTDGGWWTYTDLPPEYQPATEPTSDSTRFYTGGHAMLVTSAPACEPWVGYTIEGLTPGSTYTARARLWIPSGSDWPGHIDVDHLHTKPGGGTAIELRYAFAQVTEAWTELAVTFTAPNFDPELRVLTAYHSTRSMDSWVDSVYVGDAGEYFDGDDPDTPTLEHEWADTPHASISRAHTIEQVSASSITCSWQPRKRLAI